MNGRQVSSGIPCERLKARGFKVVELHRINFQNAVREEGEYQ